jgi:hypothetical protein
MRRRVVLAVLAVFVFLAAPGAARACSCYCAPDPWPMVEGTAVIFNGRIVATRVVGAYRHYDVAVTAVRKGAVDEKLTVSTPNSSAACGMTGLAVGDELLFLAYPAGERAGLGINSCGMGCAQRHRAAIEAGLKVCPPGGPCTGER